MSSFTRTLQRTTKRKKHFNGRGGKLGVTNPKAADLTARLARESAR